MNRKMTQRPEDTILINSSMLEPTGQQCDRLISACRSGPIEWDLVFRASIVHKVTPLVHHNLKRREELIGSLPEQVEARFIQASRRSSVHKLIVANGIADVARFFDRHSHDVLILKHTAYHLKLKRLYDMTMSDDFDLVVRPRSEAAEIDGAPYLWSANSTPDATWKVVDELIALNDPRLLLLRMEIDNRLHHDVVWNGVIPIDFRRIWNDADRYHVADSVVFAPEVYDLIVISAVNIFRKPALRLRNIVEIHELIQNEKGFDWEALSAKALAYRCGSLVYSAVCATRAILGTEIHDKDLKMLTPTILRTRAISLVNQKFSPCARSQETTLDSRDSSSSHRGISDLVRRLLALDLAQIARFVWFRIILRRVARVIKH